MKSYKWRVVAYQLWIMLALSSVSWSADYILGPEDVVQISVWGNPGLSVTVPVRPDGKISIPLGEDVVASGKSPAQLRQTLADELRKYIKDPTVSVVVTQINSPKVFLVGGRATNGVVTLRSEMTLLQLVSTLGPLTDLDLANTYIIRDHKRLDLDLRDLVEKGLPEKDILLERGDIIHIPNAFGQRITVIGEVTRPSNIAYRPGLKLVDALIESGWVTQYANLKRVLVIRQGEKDNVREVNVTAIKNGEQMQENIDLKPGDVVVVKERLL